MRLWGKHLASLGPCIHVHKWTSSGGTGSGSVPHGGNDTWAAPWQLEKKPTLQNKEDSSIYAAYLELKLELWSPAYTSTMSILNIFHDKGRLDFLTLHLIPFSKNTTFQLPILLHMSVSLCYFCKDGNESGQEIYFVWFAMCYGHVLGFSDTNHLKNSCAICAHLWSKMNV